LMLSISHKLTEIRVLVAIEKRKSCLCEAMTVFIRSASRVGRLA
jgi:hypothetical protein